MNETAIKLTITGLLAALSVWIAALAVPVALLVFSMVLDYITGLLAAAHRDNSITSYRSLNGIAKKVSSLLLVVVGLILDCLILYCQESFGLFFPWSFVIAAIISIWLTINEIISILENIQDIGINMPFWIFPLIKNIKSKVENISLKIEQEDKED